MEIVILDVNTLMTHLFNCFIYEYSTEISAKERLQMNNKTVCTALYLWCVGLKHFMFDREMILDIATEEIARL